MFNVICQWNLMQVTRNKDNWINYKRIHRHFFGAKNNVELPVQFSRSMFGPIVRNNPMLRTRISEMLPWLIFIGYCSDGSMTIFHVRLNELEKSKKGVSFKGKDRDSTQISSRYTSVAFKDASIFLLQDSSYLVQFTLDRVRIVS
jgi:hypothetical protein